MLVAPVFWFAMGVGVALTVVVDQRRPQHYALAKTLTSLVFVAAAVWPWRTATATSISLLVALLLSLLGDVLLAQKGHGRLFMAGLLAFLLAHVGFAVTALTVGIDASATAMALGMLLLVAFPFVRWLWPKAPPLLRWPVVAYVAAIIAMVSLTAGAALHDGKGVKAVGAVLFLLSDVLVARERFVRADRFNSLVGLPLYYFAQLLLIEGYVAAAHAP